MFHFAPRHHTPTALPCESYLSTAPSSYDAYDARRSHLEQLALAQRQQERRQAEEALISRRQQKAAIEKEEERRRIAAYQAALEQQIYAELEEERQLRAHRQARLREQQQRKVVEEEHQRRTIAARQQQDYLRRRQEQAYRQQLAAREQQPEEEDNSLEVHLQPLLQLLFGYPSPTPATTSPPTAQPQPQPESTPATNPEPVAAAPAPARSPSPAAPAEEPSPKVDPAASSAAEKLQHHYRTHLHRRQALSTLFSLAASLDAQQSSFALPSALTFQPSPPSSTIEEHTSSPTSLTSTPKLAFQSSNASFLAYEDFLVGLLSKIDAVSSGGDRSIKQARKQLVKRVDAELARLDGEREQAWARQQASEVEPEQVQEEQVEQEVTEDAANSDDLAALLDSDLSSSSADAFPSPDPFPTAAASTAPPALGDTSTPLTSTTLASLPSSPSPRARNLRRSGSAASSDSGSDETLSTASHVLEAAIEDVVRQAHKLGEEVVMLEKVELGKTEEDQVAKVPDDYVFVL